MENNVLNQSIAGFNCHKQIIDGLLKLKSIPFNYVFGGIDSPLTGGRFIPCPFDGLEFRCQVSLLNFYGVNVRLALQIIIVTKEDLAEPTTNYALNFLNYRNRRFGNKNGVIVASDKLRDFIKDNYPFLEVICSVIRVANDTDFRADSIDYYNGLAADYDFVVLNVTRGFDKNFLARLKDKNKFEIIINSDCIPNCPFAKEHYDAVQKVNRGISISKYCKVCHILYSNCRKLHNSGGKYNLRFSNSDIGELIELGFTNFKLEGRNYSDEEYSKDINYYLLKN